MAWRDARRHWVQLSLFACAVVFGVAAVVAVNSFSASLKREMDRQARQLLGADLVFRSRQPFSERVETFFRRLDPADQARETRFSTMAYMPRQDATRLVYVRAMEGGFPWHGELDTDPDGLGVAGADRPVALVEDGLAVQFGIRPGDTLKLGEATFEVIGLMEKMPGEQMGAGTFAPRVLIPRAYVEATGLIQYGSRVGYRAAFVFPQGLDAERARALEEAEALLEEEEIRYDTVEEERREAGESLEDMNRFLALVGFVALALGGVGMAGAAQVYVKGKRETVATLRCLGARLGQCLAAIGLQTAAVGVGGAMAGALLGMGLSAAMPWLLRPYLPVELEAAPQWGGVGLSFLFGCLFALLFAALPLLEARQATPLMALRARVEGAGGGWRDPRRWIGWAAAAAASLAFAVWQAGELWRGLAFAGGLAGAAAALAALALALRALLRRLRFEGLPFAWRHGLANLYRPDNRTTYLVVTLGLGIFFLHTLHVSERTLLAQADFADAGDRPNTIVFDVQPDQREEIRRIVAEAGAELQAFEPIVTMRLSELRGRPVEELLAAPSLELERWALRREYRSTYRDRLREDERLVAGAFVGRVSEGGEEPVPISVESRIVEALDLKLGDRMVWDVQGVPVAARVASVREVEWRRMRPNFFVVFPAGVLEAAPATFIAAARAGDEAALARMQREIVKAHPNVSAVDLTMIIESLRELFGRAAFAARFMAAFTILTGAVGFVTAIVTSRYQRRRESALLRVLGASENRIRSIMAVEYALVGTLASVSGVALSWLAGWALAWRVFDAPLVFSADSALAAVAAGGLGALGAGLANSFGVARHPPLAALRRED